MKRVTAPFVRHVLDNYRRALLAASDAAEELHLSRSRFYQLYSDYLRACALRKADTWQHGPAGDHCPTWPVEVTGDIYFLRSVPDPQKQPLILLHHPIF